MYPYLLVQFVFMGCVPMEALMIQPVFRPISGPPLELKGARGLRDARPVKAKVINAKKIRRFGVRGC